MPSGNNPVQQTISFEKVENASAFADFKCGIESLDDFIRNELQDYMVMGCETFCVKIEEEVAGMFCLSTHSLFLSDAVKEKMEEGLKPSPIIEERPYWEFINSFPAVEISYLAVDKRFQGQRIGTFIVEEIMKYVAKKADQEYDFVTVRAYNTDAYSAIPFYRKCGFTEAAKQETNTNLFMYRIIDR